MLNLRLVFTKHKLGLSLVATAFVMIIVGLAVQLNQVKAELSCDNSPEALVRHIIQSERPKMGAKEKKFWYDVIMESSRSEGIPADLWASIVVTENRLNGKGLSSAGALGASQVMPFWTNKGNLCEGLDLNEIESNLKCGAKIYKTYLAGDTTFDKGSVKCKGDIEVALRCYNNGPHGQHKVQEYADKTLARLAKAHLNVCRQPIKA